MLKENLEEQCGKICPGLRGGLPTFAPSDGVIGYIDTSGAGDGTRGIAFFSNRLFINFGNGTKEIPYNSIKDLRIISSFEDSFADELSIIGSNYDIRISDYSLDKFELKQLLEELCREREQVSERREAYAEKYAEIIAQKLSDSNFEDYSENISENISDASGKSEPVILEEIIPAEDGSPVIEEMPLELPERPLPPKDYAPEPIPEDKIDWISGKNIGAAYSTIDFSQPSEPVETAPVEKKPPESVEKKTPEPVEEKEPEKAPEPKMPVVMSGVIDRIPIIEKKAPLAESAATSELTPPSEPTPPPELTPAPTEYSDTDMLEKISNMSEDEMMKFMANTLGEINGVTEEPPDEPFFPESTPKIPPAPQAESKPAAQTEESKPAVQAAAPESVKLTEEPVWGDIYIKASRNLRELCENGKITMDQIESELKARLVPAAEMFEKITSNEATIPKVMIPKITELKAAADDFEKYFSYGEDVAARAMFFMLYQMLTYSDRIVESEQTKAALNDFFRRFGPAGITLSMLDMRI